MSTTAPARFRKLRSILARAGRIVPLLLIATGAHGQAQAPERSPHAFLTKHVGFTAAELAQVERGAIVTKALERGSPTEVAVFGIVWVEGRIDDFVDRYRDIERLLRGDAVRAIRKLSDPPTLADFAGLTLSDDDLAALPQCRLQKCAVKIDDYALERFQTEVDWSAPDAAAQANALARRLLFDLVTDYRQGGNEALGKLRDQRHPTRIREEFEGLLENSPYLPEYLPALHAYLRDYPAGRPDGTEEFFYWSTVNFGLQDTLRLNHVVTYRDPKAPEEVVIASKMLYASHYFHTALELTYTALDTARPDATGFYLIMVNRSRSDGLTGLFGGLIRSRATSGALSGLQKLLAAEKAAMEGSFRR